MKTNGDEGAAAPAQEAQKRIVDGFNAYFRKFGIRIPAADVMVGGHGRIAKRGWLIAYRIDPDDAGKPSLEFYATHRMTDDRHLRIRADGDFERLRTIHGGYGYKPEVPGSEEAARDAYLRHNREVVKELLGRGLYPHGDINAFLATDGAEFEDPSEDPTPQRDGRDALVE
jgi:hypothetical protein